ncbi:MAG: hypothetical protein ACOCXH_06480 [Cyclobacteriaceae bacterium]
MKAQSFYYPFSLKLDSGDILPELRLQYYTAGKINHNHENVVWLCHSMLHDGQFERWWPGMVGPGKVFDTEKYFIISVDMPAGLGKSSGPLSTEPATDYPYLHDFPALTIKDLSNFFDLLREHLQIPGLHSLVGIGMGAQVALNWNCEKSDLSDFLILLGGGGCISSWSRQHIIMQENVLKLDPTWQLHSRKAGENSMTLLTSMLKNSMLGSYQLDQSKIDNYWHKQTYLPLNPFSITRLNNASNGYVPDVLQLKNIKANILMLLSTNDPWADHEAQLELLLHMQNAEFHYLPSQLGSLAYFENNELIIRELQAVYHQKFKQKLA